MVGHDVDSLPASVEKFADAADDPTDLFVEVVDEAHTDVVPAVVDLPGFSPRGPCRVASLGGPEDLHAVVSHQGRSTWIDALVPVAALAG